MTRFLTGMMLLLAVNQVCLAQGRPLGPDDGDAVLKLPGSDAPRPAAAPTNPMPPVTPSLPTAPVPTKEAPGVLGLWKGAQANLSAPLEGTKIALPKLAPPSSAADPNRDILITPEQGPWVITIICYTDGDASLLANEMATELRTRFKLPAYVFNYGAEEKRKEYERVKSQNEKYVTFLKEHNLATEESIKVPYTYVQIKEQCAVLVGGYADEATARRELENIKRLPSPDPNKVKLNIFSVLELDIKTKKMEQIDRPVNPFPRAFVSRNPSCKNERPAQEKLSVAALRRLNSEESFSLLQSKKKVTLAVKVFQTDQIVQGQSAGGAFMNTLGLGGKSVDRVDGAAHNAHNVAELLRKMNFKAYVLHTKTYSVVTVGEFESHDDPALPSMKNLLATRLAQPQLAFIQFFPSAVPIEIPR